MQAALLPTGRLKRPPSHPLPSSAPKHSLSLLLVQTDTRRECLSSRETVIKSNHLVLVRRSCQKSSWGFKFTKFFSVFGSPGEGDQEGSLFYSPQWPQSSVRGNQMLIATFQRGVRFVSLNTMEERRKSMLGKVVLTVPDLIMQTLKFGCSWQQTDVTFVQTAWNLWRCLWSPSDQWILCVALHRSLSALGGWCHAAIWFLVGSCHSLSIVLYIQGGGYAQAGNMNKFKKLSTCV